LAEGSACMYCKTGVQSASFIDIERPLTSYEPTPSRSWRYRASVLPSGSPQAIFVPAIGPNEIWAPVAS